MAIGWLVLSVAVCGTAPITAGDCPLTSPPEGEPHSIYYELGWQKEGIVQAADGGWSVTSDLGYEVQLDEGYLVSYSAQLVPCENDDPLLCRATLPSFLSTKLAHAGHSTGTADPSAIETAVVESLSSPVTLQFGAALAQPQRYCTLHYLAARADQDSQNLPSQPDLIGSSIYLKGSYRAPGQEDRTPFEVSSDSAYGIISPLTLSEESEPTWLHSGTTSAYVLLERALDRMFDGIELSTTLDRNLPALVLKNLVSHSRLTLYTDDAQDPR